MSSSRENQTQFNLRQAKNFIKFIIDTNRANAKKGIGKKVAFELVGDAGLGKTSAVLQVVEEDDMDFHKLNLAQIEEIGDLVGFPIKKYIIKKKNQEGVWEEKTVNEKSLHAWYTAGWQPTDNDPMMSYAPPEWIVNRKDSGILLLDDWTRADVRFIQAVMDLIDRSEYISWKLPSDWHIVLTSNPDNGEYMVNSTDDAQATRFLTANVKYDEKIWAEWAENNYIDSRCINFMLMNPEAVTGIKDEDGVETKYPANPRQWVNFFLTIGNLGDYKTKENLTKIETVGQMAVGHELISTFIAFIHNKMDMLIEPEFMLKEKSTEKVLAAIKDCLGTGNKYRSDIASVLSIRFANYMIRYAKDHKVGDDVIDRAFNIITKEVFGSDLSYAMAKKIYYNNRQKFLKLVSKPEFMNYILTK